MDLYNQITYWAETKPTLPVFINETGTLTYEELFKQSAALSVFLEEMLGDDPSPVLIYGHMQLAMLPCFIGTVKSGRAYIPVDSSIPLERVQKIIEDSDTKAILALSSLPFEITAQKFVITSTNLEERFRQYEGRSLPHHKEVRGDDTFYIIYTSGSTGNPKGVQISYDNLIYFSEWLIKDFHLENNQRFLNQAPFSFDLSVMDLYPGILTGGTLWAISKDLVGNPKALFHQLSQSCLDVWTSTPSFVEMCLAFEGFSAELLPNLNVFLFCGETLSAETVKKLYARFPESIVYNTYGPTETTVAVTQLRVTDEILNEYKTLPIGEQKNSKVMILNDQLKELENGEKGQIIILGSSVSKGYYKQKELTDKAFFFYKGKPAYKTGDLGYFKDGYLFYAGRMDFQIKLNGYRIEIEDIEVHLRNLDLVDQAIVVPVFKEGKCQQIIAAAVVKNHDFEKEYQLTSFLRKELVKKIPSYMIPRKFIYVESIPMTNNGKIDRKKISSEVLL
ncbi:D-alanine--poly(phosphoribitol) ligase subunit DltA [Metabacillus sp. RGM 3146]|uniref:D-alanine--poly(phosphoribitol) ligase subunit DltA n=1 Tax=Metabacillus sp. RGM 3146 TaxID=3401092 RepID=UPI003B9B564E